MSIIGIKVRYRTKKYIRKGFAYTVTTLFTVMMYIILAHRDGLPELFDYYTGDIVREYTGELYQEMMAPFFSDKKKKAVAGASPVRNFLDTLTREPRYLYTQDLIEALSMATDEVPAGVRDDLYSMATYPALVEWIKNPRGNYASIFQYEFIRQLDSYSYLQEIAVFNSEKTRIWARGDAGQIATGRDWEHLGSEGFSVAVKERGQTVGYIQGNWDVAQMGGYPEVAHPGLGISGVMISAIRLPPKEGATCNKCLSAVISSPIQSAVRPVPRRLATRGANSLPKDVAPIKMISG